MKNLSYKTTEQELKDLFEDNVGDVSYVELYSDENGKVRQMWYLFVKFKVDLSKVHMFSEGLKISTLDLSYVVAVKTTVEISQNFVTFSEYMN